MGETVGSIVHAMKACLFRNKSNKYFIYSNIQNRFQSKIEIEESALPNY